MEEITVRITEKNVWFGSSHNHSLFCDGNKLVFEAIYYSESIGLPPRLSRLEHAFSFATGDVAYNRLLGRGQYD